MTDPITAEFNIRMAERHPNWYALLPQVEAAMAHQAAEDRIYLAAGWSGDEDQWLSPWGHTQRDWEDAGLPFPTDVSDYAELLELFADALTPEADIDVISVRWLRHKAGWYQDNQEVWLTPDGVSECEWRAWGFTTPEFYAYNAHLEIYHSRRQSSETID